MSAARGGSGEVGGPVAGAGVVEADDEVRFEVRGLGDEEGVDAPGFADEGDVRFNVGRDRLEEGDVGAAREVPVLGVTDDVVEDGFAGRERDDSGVADAGLEPPYGVLRGVVQPEDVGVLGGGGCGRQVTRRGRGRGRRRGAAEGSGTRGSWD